MNLTDNRLTEYIGGTLSDIGIVQAVEGEVLYLSNLREVSNLPSIRVDYNTLAYCRKGRILVEMGGNQQVHITPGQLLMVPAGKLVQPMMISTDLDATALLLSDRTLKTLLGNQLSIWNKAMYMKEIYVIDSDWVEGLGNYTKSLFKKNEKPQLFREIVSSFLRTMLLMVCEELIQHEDMTADDDHSSVRDKELFNRFLQLLGQQKLKRQHVGFYADKMHITPKYLSTIVRRVSGKTAIRWITESVMDDSYNLLTRTDLSVKEIAHQLGFPNSSFFGQYFREQAGMTPMEYRTQHKHVI